MVSTIDLGGIFMVASSSLSLINGNFFVRGPQGQFYSMTWGTGGLGDPAANQGRSELVRYTSPTWHGLHLRLLDRRARRLLGLDAALRR